MNYNNNKDDGLKELKFSNGNILQYNLKDKKISIDQDTKIIFPNKKVWIPQIKHKLYRTLKDHHLIALAETITGEEDTYSLFEKIIAITGENNIQFVFNNITYSYPPQFTAFIEAFQNKSYFVAGWKLHVALDESDQKNIAQGFNIVEKVLLKHGDAFYKVIAPGVRLEESLDQARKQITIYPDNPMNIDTARWKVICEEITQELARNHIKPNRTGDLNSIKDRPIFGSMGYITCRNSSNNKEYVSAEDTIYYINHIEHVDPFYFDLTVVGGDALLDRLIWKKNVRQNIDLLLQNHLLDPKQFFEHNIMTSDEILNVIMQKVMINKIYLLELNRGIYDGIFSSKQVYDSGIIDETLMSTMPQKEYKKE